MSASESNPPRRFTTGSGVTVIVDPSALPAPVPAPEPPDPYPRVVVVPPGQPAEDRDALLRSLIAEHGAFIRQALLRRGHVPDESVKDLRQRVLLVLCDHLEKKEPIENVRGFLVGVIRNEIRAHRRRFRPDVRRDADAEGEAASAPSPETDAARAERREKLDRYLGRLPPEEAEAVRAVDIDGLTIEEAAAALGRHRGTVATRLARARDNLRAMALASERATALGARRRPPQR